MSETIDCTPTFNATANMLRIIMENGTDEGRAMAFEEIARWGRMIDRLIAERRQHAKSLRGIYADSITRAHQRGTPVELFDCDVLIIEKIIGELEA
jgi:hypothetical protein